MKILYYIDYELNKSQGVAKKIVEQVRAWESNGHSIVLLTIGEKITIFNNIVSDKIKLVEIQYFNSYIKKICFRLLLINNIKTIIRKESPDIIYHRSSSLNGNTRYIASLNNSIFEINTNIKEEGLVILKDKFFKRINYLLYYFFFKFLIIKKSIFFCTVTFELKEFIKSINKKSVVTVIPNGITIKRDLKNKNVINNDRIKLFFIGKNNQPWHGIEKLTELAKLLPFNFVINVFGYNGLSTDNIKFHGYASKEIYEMELINSHICIGSLSMYLNNMNEACPLKVREYMAYKKPTIIAYQDTALANYKSEYILQLPNNNSNIADGVHEIISFCTKNHLKEIEDDELLNLFDIKYLEEKRLAFFKSI